MINFSCSDCGERFSVPDDKAGKTAKCPKCGSGIRIPSPDPQWSEQAAQPDAPAGARRRPSDRSGGPKSRHPTVVSADEGGVGRADIGRSKTAQEIGLGGEVELKPAANRLAVGDQIGRASCRERV